MNYKTRIFFSVLVGLGFTGCEQRDDQALIKVYEVFQRDMQKRDEVANGSMKLIQDELAALKATLEEVQKQKPDSGASAESEQKIADRVTEAVGKKLAENATTLVEMKVQIAALQSTLAKAAVVTPPAPVAATPPPPPAPATTAAAPGEPASASTAGGLRYRDQAPVAPPPPSSTKSSDPSRKKIKIDF